uniref:Retinoic acid receptor responder 1 n=1 Tax=Sciurus vulgaris TaxID=55149 RepID=A0A8D2D6M6_SCIVU
MQPRGQPRSAPRPGPARPFAPPRALLPLLLLLLALRGAAATLKDPGAVDAPEPPSPGMLQQAARVALHFFNFRAGSPSALRVLDKVQEVGWQADPTRGYQVNLVFSTQAYHLQDRERRLGRCSAQVLFKNQKPGPAVTVRCAPLPEKSMLQEDRLLFKQLKQLKDALNVSSIPDDYGNIDPSVRPMWDLAVLGSSYVMWERTTQFLYYYPLRISSVKQWKTSDHAIDFDYIILLHEFPTQEIIPCHIHLIWYPGKWLKVSYHCEEMQTSEASSGTEEGSAVAPTDFSNF